MRMRAIACMALLAWGGAAFAADAAKSAVEPVPEMGPANNNLANIASLQRGAKYFVNYCLGCHSAKYMRYNQLAAGLDLTDKQVADNLMFTGKQPYDTLQNAMREKDATNWFGKAPPDLSLIALSRSPDYIYNYLRSFYEDDSRPTGANNLVLKNSAMPDILWELQGIRKPVYKEGAGPKSANPEIVGFDVVKQGLLSEQDFDQVARDITNFLDYVSQPMRKQREALGMKVLGFLVVFLILTYLLKKEIWKDVE